MKMLCATIALIGIAVILPVTISGISHQTDNIVCAEFAVTNDTPSAKVDKVTDLGAVDTYEVRYSCSALLVPSVGRAALVSPEGRVWDFQYSQDKVNWKSFDSVISDMNAEQIGFGAASSHNGGPVVITGRYIRIRCRSTLKSAGKAEAQGAAALSVTRIR